jgi:hypothetical protein
MAGFAVIAMLATLLFFSSIVAIVASIVGYLLARKKVRQAGLKRHALIYTSAVAPFLALGWGVLSVIFYVWISNQFADQACGFSPDPYVTLPNGYVFGSLNTYNGYIVAPGYKTDTAWIGPGYVRGVITIQFDGEKFSGLYSEPGFTYRYVFDTRDRTIKTIPAGQMSFEQAQTIAHAGPSSYWYFYDRYYHRWPKYVLIVLLIGGWSAIGFCIWKLSQSPALTQHEGTS